jgi:hypothetical protein
MPLLSRLKRARLVRVLLVYFAASWVVIQAAHLFQAALDLPEWLVPVAVVLLLVGLVVVGATAWVQASPATDRREAAGEVPGDAAPALLRRADIHDDLGDRDRARQLRGQFLALWSGADPEHPMVRAARRGLAPG